MLKSEDPPVLAQELKFWLFAWQANSESKVVGFFPPEIGPLLANNGRNHRENVT